MFIIAFELSAFCIVVEVDSLFSPTFQLHLSLINACTVLLLLIIFYSWRKHLLLIKLFTVHINYLSLMKIFTVNNNCLPLIEIFTVNKSYLPLIKLFTVFC